HLGLPDMVRHSIEGLPEIIDTEINLRKSDKTLKKSILYTGKYFTGSSRKILKAFYEANNQYKEYIGLMSNGVIPINAVGVYEDLTLKSTATIEDNKTKILLLGHSYNI